MPLKNYTYLDYVSTTPLHPDVLETYTQLLKTYFANSDSLHDLGVSVKKLQEKGRQQIADLLRVHPEEIIFTSGASEASNAAIKGVCWARQNLGRHIITTAIEHSSVRESCSQLQELFGFEVTYLNPNAQGSVSLADVAANIRSDTVLVSIMMVNNEIGSINPVEEIARYVKRNSRAYFHVDAVQALGKLELDLTDVDLASFSMHKIFGLKGSGILMKKRHVEMVPLISAGQQEGGYRGGTSNACVNIVAAKTIRLALEKREEHYQVVKLLNTHLRSALKDIDGMIINTPENGSPFILNFSYPKLTSEVMMNALNTQGFALSAQSTCHTKAKTISPVYRAMHYSDDRANGSLRIGLDYPVNIADLDAFISALKGIIETYG